MTQNGISETIANVAGRLRNVAILMRTNDRRLSAEEIGTVLDSAAEALTVVAEVLDTPIQESPLITGTLSCDDPPAAAQPVSAEKLTRVEDESPR